jgi:hypothetical protein
MHGEQPFDCDVTIDGSQINLNLRFPFYPYFAFEQGADMSRIADFINTDLRRITYGQPSHIMRAHDIRARANAMGRLLHMLHLLNVRYSR